MDKYRKLVQNSGIFFVANFGSKVLSFLLVRFYTEYLTTSEYGKLDIINTTSSLAIPLITLCITEAVLRLSIDDTEGRSDILSNGVLIVLLGNFIFFLLGPILIKYETIRDNIIWLYMLTLSNALYNVVVHFTRGIGQSKTFALTGVLHTFIQIILNIITLAIMHAGISGYLFSAVVANIICILFAVLSTRSWKYFKFRININYLKLMLIYSIPLIPNALCWWIMQSADRYVISWMMTDADNGLYAAANKIPTIITTISTIFIQAWQLSSVDEANSKDKTAFFTNVFQIISFVLIASVSILLLFLQPIYRVYVQKNYYSGWNSVPLLLIAMVFSCFSSFLGTNYVAMKKTQGAFTTTIFGAVINIVLNILLTPIWGIRGTALATAVSFFATWIIRAYNTKAFVRIHYSVPMFIIPISIVTVQALILSFYSTSIIYQFILLCSIFLFYIPMITKIYKKFCPDVTEIIRNIRRTKNDN